MSTKKTIPSLPRTNKNSPLKGPRPLTEKPASTKKRVETTEDVYSMPTHEENISKDSPIQQNPRGQRTKSNRQASRPQSLKKKLTELVTHPSVAAQPRDTIEDSQARKPLEPRASTANVNDIMNLSSDAEYLSEHESSEQESNVSEYAQRKSERCQPKQRRQSVQAEKDPVQSERDDYVVEPLQDERPLQDEAIQSVLKGPEVDYVEMMDGAAQPKSLGLRIQNEETQSLPVNQQIFQSARQSAPMQESRKATPVPVKPTKSAQASNEKGQAKEPSASKSTRKTTSNKKATLKASLKEEVESLVEPPARHTPQPNQFFVAIEKTAFKPAVMEPSATKSTRKATSNKTTTLKSPAKPAKKTIKAAQEAEWDLPEVEWAAEPGRSLPLRGKQPIASESAHSEEAEQVEEVEELGIHNIDSLRRRARPVASMQTGPNRFNGTPPVRDSYDDSIGMAHLTTKKPIVDSLFKVDELIRRPRPALKRQHESDSDEAPKRQRTEPESLPTSLEAPEIAVTIEPLIVSPVKSHKDLHQLSNLMEAATKKRFKTMERWYIEEVLMRIDNLDESFASNVRAHKKQWFVF